MINKTGTFTTKVPVLLYVNINCLNIKLFSDKYGEKLRLIFYNFKENFKQTKTLQPIETVGFVIYKILSL